MPTFASTSIYFANLVRGHSDLLLYLAPAIVLAVAFRYLAKRHPAFFLLYLTGTTIHEISHLVFGLLTGARPVSLSIFPRRAAGQQWILGSVRFTNIRWWNAMFVGLAPLSTLFMPFWVADWRTQNGLVFGWPDLAISAVLAPMFISFWPSTADFKIARRSWPYMVVVGLCTWWAWR